MIVVGQRLVQRGLHLQLLDALQPKADTLSWRLAVIIGAWLGLGILDFATGFVAFSIVRLVVLCACALLLLPITIPIPMMRAFAWPGRSRMTEMLGAGVLTVLGLAFFVSRYHRGAHMGDTQLFWDSISHNTPSCLLCNPYEGGTHFRAHNSLGQSHSKRRGR